MLFANTLGDAQKLMKALDKCCMHAKLSVNISKSDRDVGYISCTLMGSRPYKRISFV